MSFGDRFNLRNILKLPGISYSAFIFIVFLIIGVYGYSERDSDNPQKLVIGSNSGHVIFSHIHHQSGGARDCRTCHHNISGTVGDDYSHQWKCTNCHGKGRDFDYVCSDAALHKGCVGKQCADCHRKAGVDDTNCNKCHR